MPPARRAFASHQFDLSNPIHKVKRRIEGVETRSSLCETNIKVTREEVKELKKELTALAAIVSMMQEDKDTLIGEVQVLRAQCSSLCSEIKEMKTGTNSQFKVRTMQSFWLCQLN